VGGDIPDRHPTGVDVKHPLVETGQAGLALGDKLGLKAPVAVTRRLDRDRAELRPDRLGGRPVADVAGAARRRLPERIAQMAGQLGPQRGLDHPARELRQQPARARDLLRLEPLERVLERLGGQQLGEPVDLPRGKRLPDRLLALRGQGCPLPARPSWSLATSPSGLHGSRPRRQAAVSVTPTSHRTSDRPDLIARGLGAPLLIVADDAPGLIKAIEQCWPASDRQRCCVHRARNLYAKLPERERERVKHSYWRALDDAISPSDAKQRLQALVDELDKGGYAAAARCLADDLDALVVHLRYPPRHRRRWRSTNLLERSLGEVKRRTKVMGRFPGEESCLTLVWAVLDLLITHQTNGIHFNQLDRQRLKRMRYEGTEQTIPEEVTAA
jgi:hypothetical protein